MTQVITYTDQQNDSDPIILTTDAQLDLANGSATQSGAISESGGSFGVQKTGNGSLTLAGTPNYTGATTVSAGTLRLGTPGYTLSLGNIVMQGGTLDINGHVLTASGFSGSGGDVLMNNGMLTVTSAASANFAGNMSGSGKLWFQGGGTIVLTGNVSLDNGQNGSIQLEDATLQVGDGGTTGSLYGKIGSNQGGTVVFDRSDVYEFSGSLGLATNLEQLGTGTLVISAANNTIGSTRIENGTLEIGPSGSLGYNTAQSIIDDSHLVLAGSHTSTGPISGTGTVAVTQGAVVGLFGFSTYTGGTTIQDSTLRLYGSSVTGAIVDNGILQLGSSNSATVSNNISGTGSVTIEGDTSIALAGSNSYSGGTDIYGGTLMVDRDNELGASTSAVNFTSPDNGYATLKWMGSFDLSPGRPVDIAGGTAIFDTGGFDTTIAQAIGGSGVLEKDGAGTLTLLAASNFSGVVLVNSGMLRLAQGAGLANVTGLTVYNSGTAGVFDMTDHDMTVTQLGGNGTVVLGDGTLIVDNDTQSSFAGTITGSGSLVKKGSGTLWMASQNQYTGPTLIEDGVLQLGSANTHPSFADNIVDDATLALGGAMDYGGQISGTGNVTFADYGTVRLTGTSTYTGTTQIDKSGQLVVDGSIVSSVTVISGALAGTGTVSSVTLMGGTLRPGDDDGTLKIQGGLTMTDQAGYQVGISAAGVTSTQVTGSATIAGALYLAETQDTVLGTFTILSAQGGLSGQFSGVYPAYYGVGPGPATRAFLTQDAHNLYLTLRPLHVESDFNLDSESDILWQNSDGSVVIYFMNGSTTQSAVGLGDPGAAWKVKFADDLDGDGKSDLIWQNDDGTAVVYLMDGSTVTSTAGLGNPGAAWKIKATGDLNGDGRSDILWQNDNGTAVVYLMNGGAIGSVAGLGNPGPSWHIRASADFDGDGRSDILWQNDDGTTVTWFMFGKNVLASTGVGNPGTAWHIRDTADFNGDGKSDILWQNDDGTTVVWFMNGATVTSAGGVGNPGSAWHITATGDINGDGKADITWQNDDGNAVVWLMNGSTIAGYAGLGNPGSSWHVVTG